MDLRGAMALAGRLPEVTQGTRYGNRTHLVAGKAFAWERPYSKADLRRFGDLPVPAEPILAVRTANLDAKESLLAEGRPGFFTIPHFDGFPAVLISLPAAEHDDVAEAVTDAWLAVAPTSLAARLADR